MGNPCPTTVNIPRTISPQHLYLSTASTHNAINYSNWHQCFFVYHSQGYLSLELRMPTSPRITARRSAGSSFDSQNEHARVAGARNKDKRCQYCERTFKKTEHLLRHERSHTKEKPFRCELCSKAYTRQYSRHLSLSMVLD